MDDNHWHDNDSAGAGERIRRAVGGFGRESGETVPADNSGGGLDSADTSAGQIRNRGDSWRADSGGRREFINLGGVFIVPCDIRSAVIFAGDGDAVAGEVRD